MYSSKVLIHCCIIYKDCKQYYSFPKPAKFLVQVEAFYIAGRSHLDGGDNMLCYSQVLAAFINDSQEKAKNVKSLCHYIPE